MTTFLSILGAVFLVLFIMGVIALLWIRSKARKAGAFILVASLKAALTGLQEKAATPAHADDKELADLISRLDTVYTKASAALKQEDYVGAMKIAAPMLDELTAYRKAQSAVVVDEQAHAPAQESLLPAPADTVAAKSDAAVSPDATDAGEKK